jgi:peptidoglycan/xylan/chitin deacetylase (PgdA/CDA1 family)
MADDDPYELMEDGEPTGIVEIPVEWIRDDMPYFGMDFRRYSRPHTPPGSALDIFKAEFDMAKFEGGLFQLTMHPHIIGHRSRMMMLDELIRHIQASGPVWFATHADIARYCKEHAGV